MKHIRIWKLALLITVTLGIYGLYWFIRTAKDLNVQYKQRVPHWLWLILPIVAAIALVCTSIIMLIAGAIAGTPVLLGVGVIVYVVMLLATVIPAGIILWWMWHFSKAVSNVTNGRIPTGWSFVLYVVTGMYVSLPQQYYLNRADAPAAFDPAKKVKPSRAFITYSVVVIILSLVLSSVFTVMDISSMSDVEQESQQAIEDANARFDAINRQMEAYTKEYDACIDDLNTTYPDEQLAAEDETAYMQQYDACEKIRAEQDEFIKNNQ